MNQVRVVYVGVCTYVCVRVCVAACTGSWSTEEAVVLRAEDWLEHPSRMLQMYIETCECITNVCVYKRVNGCCAYRRYCCGGQSSIIVTVVFKVECWCLRRRVEITWVYCCRWWGLACRPLCNFLLPFFSTPRLKTKCHHCCWQLLLYSESVPRGWVTDWLITTFDWLITACNILIGWYTIPAPWGCI